MPTKQSISVCVFISNERPIKQKTEMLSFKSLKFKVSPCLVNGKSVPSTES